MNKWCLVVAVGVSGPVFAAADLLYDFGSQYRSPKSSSTNPALLFNCEDQISTGFAVQKTQFSLEGDRAQQAGDNRLGVDFGLCKALLPYVSVGLHVNANALSFGFETQNQAEPIVFPYGQQSLPISSGGIAVKITEPFAVGFAWKLVEKVAVDARVPVDNFALQAQVDVDIRPSASWLLGASYVHDAWEIHYSYSPELRGDLELDVELPVQLGGLGFTAGLLNLQSALSYIPARNQLGLLGQYRDLSYDIGIVQNQWSKFDAPFLEVNVLANLDSLLFEQSQVTFRTTYEPYAIFGATVAPQWEAKLGYAYRPSPVKAGGSTGSVVGADLHSFKAAVEHRLEILDRTLLLGADLTYGLITGIEQGQSNDAIDGWFYYLQTSLRLPLS